eukprot:CAMPEP_0117509232 /NCGR_PEP_ID=MMETSP0784-20121206/27367_1 /TAXON_ID=39447 /ORGANISM="" /LENGTH=221 /DNA_ID=CAMNT_0005304829 /DNA_START=20 /DNA_END=682 /DNA_ORIENTATION=+
MAALARGCALELQHLDRGLRGPGFFACDGREIAAAGELFVEAYAASRLLHDQDTSAGIRCKPRRNPQRWWFTAVEGRPWPGEADEPVAADAVRALDAHFAEIAAILAGAAFLALGLRKPTVLGGSPMLRGLRYAPVSAPGQFGIPGHVDFGDFTLCHSIHEGLQVFDRDTDEWRSLPAGELYFLAAAGLEAKTRGQVRAVEHRVNHTDRERLSFCRLHGVP